MASLSPFYYQRLFSRLVKRPAAEYMKLRRMAKAADALLDKDKRILDIALSLGFTSHEHFTRAFKDTFGMTPDDYRQNPRTLNRMTKPELKLHHTLTDEGAPLATEGMVLEVNRRILEKDADFIGLEKRCLCSLSKAWVLNRALSRWTLCGGISTGKRKAWLAWTAAGRR